MMKNRILVIILILSVLIRIVVSLLMGDNIEALPAIADQNSYHTLATRLIEGFGFTFNVDWWPVTRAGQPTAHWSYLYTFYLTLVYALFGAHPLAARLIQSVIVGLLMPWLAYRLAKRVFLYRNGEPEQERLPRITWLEPLNLLWKTGFWIIPLITAAWVAFYGYFIYFAAALMTESFYIMGIMWILDCALRIAATNGLPYSEGIPDATFRTWSRWLELGLAISLTAMLRQVILPFIPFLVLWLWWLRYRQVKRDPQTKAHALSSSLKQTVQGTVLSFVVILILIAPISAFNYHQFHRFVLLNTNSGYAFYLSNHPSYGSHYKPGLTRFEFIRLIPGKLYKLDEAALDQELLKLGFGFVLTDPMRYLRLSIDRIQYFYTFWPSPASGDFSNVNRVLSYGLAFPFIVGGIALWVEDVRRKRIFFEPGILILSFCVVYSLIHLLSWAAMRYRLPVDAVTLVFAARGLYSVGLIILFKKPQKSSIGIKGINQSDLQ